MTQSLPRIVFTPGEPAGIGPDLAIALAREDTGCDLIVCADPAMLAERGRALNVPLVVHELADARAPLRQGQLNVLPVPAAAPVRAGVLEPANAAYVVECLDKAIDACRDGHCDALVTGPIHKSVIDQHLVSFSGHTEHLGRRLGATPVMMLVAGSLRVALVTTHLPLAAVPAAITTDAVTDTIMRVHAGLESDYGMSAPRIAVCGLNPHAGEDGSLGHEDRDIIAPAIAAAARGGRRIEGPLPADTLFVASISDQYDAIIAMYHDQGLPALKARGFGAAVNVTLGLPIVRTSVDHGTALELAGSGRADAGSARAALAEACRIHASRLRRAA